MFSLIWSLLKPYRLSLAVIFFAMLVQMVASVAAPWPLKIVLDNVVGQHKLSPRFESIVHLFFSGSTKMEIAAASAIAARELPAPLAHAERAWDFFTGTDALTRDMSLNLKGIAKVIATLQEAGLLSRDAPFDPAFYIDDSYLAEARK